MIFQATEQQLLTIAANAVNASKPKGMGFLLATDQVFQPSDFKLDDCGGLSVDYVQGRMVKLTIRRSGGTHSIPDVFRSDFQSFAHTYPTPQDLLKSAGVEIV